MPLPSAYDCFAASPARTLKHSTYFAVYDRELSPYRNRAIIFVEIGVAHGGSLFMWRKFLGPKARIIGIDINPAAQKWRKEGFEIHIGDQADSNFWHGFFAQIGAVDIVLDDGGHSYRQQIITAECTLPHIKDGGLLIVEDTNTSYLRQFGGPHRHSFIEYAKRKIDRIHHRFGALQGRACAERQVYAARFYDSITVFEIDKKASAHPSRWIKSNAPKGQAWDFYQAEGAWVRRLRHRLHHWGWFKRRYRLATAIMLRTNLIARRIQNDTLGRFFQDKQR